MKKLIALLLVLAMVFAFAGCESAVETDIKTEKTTESAEGAKEPEQVSLAEALKNTMKALEAGNLTITVDGGIEATEENVPGLVCGYWIPVSGQLQVMFDADSKDLTVYGKMMSEYEIGTVLIYDGWSVSGGYYEDDWYKEDISEDLEELFAYDETEIDDLSDLLDQLPEEVLEMLEEVLDTEKLVELLETLVTEKFTDEQWVKEIYDYTVTTENEVTVHTIDLHWVTLIKQVLGHFEDAFVDQDDFEDLMESLEEGFEEVEILSFKVKLIQTGDMITGIALEFEGDEEGTYGKAEITVTLSEIGTTTIDTQMLADILEELPDYDEYYKDRYGDDEFDDIILGGTETEADL